jgi:hypothetical protein
MRSFSSLLFALFLGSALASGQRATPQSSDGNSGGVKNDPQTSQASSTFVLLPVQTCPVSLQAKQSGMTNMVKVRQGQSQQPETLPKPSQRIHLIVIGPPAGNKIVGATVSVRGLSARRHFDPASVGGGSDDLRRMMDITFTSEDNKEFSAELILPGFTAVKSIKLESLQYGDGSTRDFSSQHVCTIVPDPLMLVAGR